MIRPNEDRNDRRSISRGHFIVVEGLDGAGTTTQTELLAGYLRDKGITVETTREPSTGPVGALCRDAIEGRISLPPEALALAFAADRLDHTYNSSYGINTVLDKGTWVISDRYVLSALAYQASQGVDLKWLEAINANAQVPEVTVFVDTSESVCLERIKRRGQNEDDLFHNAARLGQVKNAYKKVLGHSQFIGGLVTADGNQPISDVFQQIQRGLFEKYPFLALREHTPIPA